MRCPHCSHHVSQVIDSRDATAGSEKRRRRVCQRCGERFTTYERIERGRPEVSPIVGPAIAATIAAAVAAMVDLDAERVGQRIGRIESQTTQTTSAA